MTFLISVFRYNSLFDILIAPAQTTANSAEGVDDSGERIRFNMQRLTSILDFDLTNSTSDPIRCVLLTAESDDFLSAKSLNFDLAQGEAAAPALDTEERSKSILINFDGGSASAAAQLDLETEALRTISTWGHRRSISAKNSSLSLTAIISSS